MSSEAIVFIVIFFVLILIPCISAGWLGCKFITKLGRFPSKTPAIQTSVVIKLAIIEIVSFTLLIAFFKILVAED